MRKVYKSKRLTLNGVIHKDVIMAGGFYIYWSGLNGYKAHDIVLSSLTKESDKARIAIVLAGEGMLEW